MYKVLNLHLPNTKLFQGANEITAGFRGHFTNGDMGQTGTVGHLTYPYFGTCPIIVNLSLLHVVHSYYRKYI